MIDYEPAQQFWRQYRAKKVVLVPYPDADGLAASAIVWHLLTGDKQIICPPKGETIYAEVFRGMLEDTQPEALIVLDQGSRAGALLPGVPTLTIDHHHPSGVPEGVYLSSYYPAELTPSAAALCYRMLGSPAELLWLAAVGLIGDYGLNVPIEEMREAATRYSKLDLQDTVAMMNAARRSSRFDWPTAFAALTTVADPRVIAHGEAPQSAQLKHDLEEVKHEVQRARKARPFFADPWAVVPFSSPCLIHGLVATSWMHRLGEHYVVAANYGYRTGYVHFSIRSEGEVDLISAVREVLPKEFSPTWVRGRYGATGGAVTLNEFSLLLTHMGFTPEQVIEIKHAARAHHV